MKKAPGLNVYISAIFVEQRDGLDLVTFHTKKNSIVLGLKPDTVFLTIPFKNLDPVEPLDAWVENHDLGGLQKDFKTHVSQYLPDSQDVEGLVRLLITSLRQELSHR